MDDNEFDEDSDLDDDGLADAWELYELGDLDGALAAALDQLESDNTAPDALNLVGTILLARGALEEAFAHFREALKFDPHFVDAMLNAADVLVQLGDPASALELAQDALENAEGNDEEAWVEAQLLQIDLLLVLERPEEADAMGKALPVGPFEVPDLAFAVGRTLFQLGDVERASGLIEEAYAVGVDHAEACYYLGLVREAQGMRREATAAFLQCRDRDLAEGAPPWAEPIPFFEKRLRAAIGRLPASISALLEGALVLVDEVPGAEVVCEGVDPRAPFLMDDVELEAESGADVLRRVFVYQRNVERFVPGPAFLDEQLTRLLLEEVPRAFGTSIE